MGVLATSVEDLVFSNKNEEKEKKDELQFYKNIGYLATVIVGGIIARFGWTSVHSFMAPEPLSPLFQKGGLLYGFNEDLTFLVLALVFVYVIDRLICDRFINQGARYYFLHACANMISSIASFPDVKRALTGDTMTSFSGPSCSMVGNSVIAAIHIYHCVAFKLSPADIFHHAVFVVTLCGTAIPYKQIGGCANTFGCFFLSGVPGGLDYVALVLMKHGKITRLQEKIFNFMINVWLRGPSMTIYATIGWLCWWNGNIAMEVPSILVFIVLGLHFYNGQYYARAVVESYAVTVERERVAKSAAIEGGK